MPIPPIPHGGPQNYSTSNANPVTSPTEPSSTVATEQATAVSQTDAQIGNSDIAKAQAASAKFFLKRKLEQTGEDTAALQTGAKHQKVGHVNDIGAGTGKLYEGTSGSNIFSSELSTSQVVNTQVTSDSIAIENAQSVRPIEEKKQRVFSSSQHIGNELDRASLPPSNSQILSKPLIAEVGFEIEIGSAQVTPFKKRGTVLAEGDGWKLETDTNLQDDKSHFEFVLSPMFSPDRIKKVLGEITDIMQELRELALKNGNTPIELNKLKTIGKISKDGMECAIAVNDARFLGTMQATYGIGLSNMAEAIDNTHLEKEAKAIHLATAKVIQHYKKKCNAELSSAASGFIELINSYLERARTFRIGEGTVHATYRVMARSDFCSIFDKLLNDTDRDQIRYLFSAPSKSNSPPFMEALGLSTDSLVFSRPYISGRVNDGRTKISGPTIKDWLTSIIDGREDGYYKKDLLSPPDGYLPHTGDLDKDYGMGAMGVDEENGLVLFEVRGTTNRPRKIPSNPQMAYFVMREYSDACRYNSKLEKYHGTSSSEEAKYKLLTKCSEEYHTLKFLQDKLNDDHMLQGPHWSYLQGRLMKRG